ncbi:MAG: sigma-70 family RNA polymerase sigma factor [Chthonomonadales bacterium]|nr:sigma-70 family RNA polymerase sigma factor [Chthonomonadales bacterium]
MIAVADADAALLARCRSNDAQAFDEIVARYKDRIYNYIGRMVGPGPDAEDLAQETFVRAYVSLRTFQSRASLNTWLYRIATNLCIDHARRGRGRATLPLMPDRDADRDEGACREVRDDRYGPEALALNAELGAEIDAALASLPRKLRSVVVLFDVEGLTYEEIARVTACPMGTVKSRLFNARQALRARLAPYLDGVLTPAADAHRRHGGSP